MGISDVRSAVCSSDLWHTVEMLNESQAQLERTPEERQAALAERDKALQIYRETDELRSKDRDHLADIEGELAKSRQALVDHERQFSKSQAQLERTGEERQVALAERDKELKLYRETDELRSKDRENLEEIAGELEKSREAWVDREE